MTKIKKLEMAQVVSNEKDITVTESFFGLCEKAIYTPTVASRQTPTNTHRPTASVSYRWLTVA